METHDDTIATFFLKLWPKIEANQNRIIGGVAIVVVVVAAYSFFSWRHEQNQIEAGNALTGTLLAMSTQADAASIGNNFLNVSTEYPNTAAGQRALMEAAAAQFEQGKYPEAQSYFHQYLDAHPEGIFAGQAALGLGKCLEAQGKVNDASGAYQHVISDIADPQSVVEAKYSLARMDMAGANYSEAMRLFSDVAQSDPFGTLGNEAAQYAYLLRSKVPARPVVTAPATTTSPLPASFKLNH